MPRTSPRSPSSNWIRSSTRPKTAKVLRLAEDGSYKQVFEGPVSARTPWLRYTYAKFDFSSVKDPGLYADRIRRHSGPSCSPSPRTSTAGPGNPAWTVTSPWRWTTSRCARATGCGTAFRTSTMPARRLRTRSTSTAGRWARTLDSPFKAGEHIPGLNVGGWYDAGDFDIQTPEPVRGHSGPGPGISGSSI